MSQTAPSDPRLEEAEGLLASLIGILSARIVAPTGPIEEIHILAAPGYHPKQVVRNVESALRAGFGIDVDRRIVSVAQLRDESGSNAAELADRQDGNHRPACAPTDAAATGEDAAAAHGDDAAPEAAQKAPPDPGRLVFTDFEASRAAGRSASCRVVLRRDDREASGSGKGPDTPAGRAEAAARAVFSAIPRLARRGPLELEGAAIVTAAGRTYVLVSAHGFDGRAATGLTGAAVVVRSTEETAILASLQAANRWLASA